MGLAKAMRLKSGVGYGVTAACEGSVSMKAGKEGEQASSGHGGSTAAASAVRQGSRSAWPRIESSGGSALDWMYHEMQVKHAYQIKLRDTGSYGFLLPAEEIVPTGKEVWNAVKWLGGYLNGNRGIEEVDVTDGRLSWAVNKPVLEESGSDARFMLGDTRDDNLEVQLQDGEPDSELSFEL